MDLSGAVIGANLLGPGLIAGVTRSYGDMYKRLTTEPIWLREIVYACGSLVSLGSVQARRRLTIEEALNRTLAEIIKAYL